MKSSDILPNPFILAFLAIVLAWTTGLAPAAPNPGPGLGNLTYTPAERFSGIDTVTEGVEIPYPPSGAPKPHFGLNVGSMANGYFVTVFAYDSGNASGGLLFFDISNPRNLSLVKSVYEPSGRTSDLREIHSMGFSNIGAAKYMILQSYRGIHVWNIADVNNPQRVGKLDFTTGGDYADTPWQLAYQHPYVYVSAANQGLFIVDITNPASPVLANRGVGKPNPIPVSQLGGFRTGPIWVMGNRMVLTSMDNTSGFSQLDIGDPLNPRITSTSPGLPQQTYSTAFNGRYLTTAPIVGNGTMRVYDLNNPNAITYLGQSAPIPETQIYCAMQDNYSFQGTEQGVYKMNIANPANPVQVGRIANLPGVDSADQVTLLGNVLFMGSDHGPTSMVAVHNDAPDTTPPVVVSMSPAPNSTDCPLSGRIGISFTDNIDLETVNLSSFRVRPLLGGSIPGDPVAGEFSSFWNIVNFTPVAPLLPNTKYEVTLAPDAMRDWAGNATPAWSATFITGQGGTGGSGTTSVQLLHRWPLEANSVDVVGGRATSLRNGAAINSGSLLLDGVNDHMLVAGNLAPILADDSMTFTFMLQTTDVGTNEIWTSPAVSGIEESGAGNDIFLGVIDASGRIGIQRGDGAGVKSIAPVNDGKWRQIIMTRDAGTGQLGLYVDGVSQGTVAGATGGSIAFASFGRLDDSSGVADYLAGRLRDIRIYRGAVPANEMAAFSLGIGLKNHWPFSANARDLVTNLDGTLQQGAAITERSLVLDGVDDRLQLPSNLNDPLGGTGSLSFFIRTSDTGADAPWDAPAVTGVDEPANNDIFWGFLDSTGRIGVQAGGGAAAKSPQPVNDNNWHHVVMTRDADTGQLQVHVDGMAGTVVTGEAGQKTTPFSALGITARTSGGPVALQAEIKDVRVYQRVVLPAQITAMRSQIQLDVTRPPAARVGDTVAFSGDAVGFGNITFSWNFGDGAPSTAGSIYPQASHVYTAPGHYQVTLTASNGIVTRAASFIQTVHPPIATGASARSSSVALRGNTVFCVNSDNDSLAAVNATTGAKLWEAATGDHPRSVALAPDGRPWVTNQGSATLTIHNAETGTIVQIVSLPRASRPFGIAFAPDASAAYVSLEATGRVARLSLSGSVTGVLDIGPVPRGLAISPDSSRLLVTRFISAADQATITEVNLSSFTVARVFSLPQDTTTLDSGFTSRGVANYLSSVTITPSGLGAWIPSKKDNTVRGTFRDGQALTFETTIRPVVSSISFAASSPVGTEILDLNDRAMPSAVEFTPMGDYAFVATEGTNTVEVIDAFNGGTLGAIFLRGLAPRGLALSGDGGTLYVHNFMTRSLEAYDVSGVRDSTGFSPVVRWDTRLVMQEALAPDVLLGKQIFYNARDGRMTRDGYLSCAICHDDGGEDGRVWDFTDRGEGLRNTITLRGRSGMGEGPVHWSGNFDEIQDFEHDIRGAFGGTGFMANTDFNGGTTGTPLGDPKAGKSVLLDALAAYVSSLSATPPSPHKNPDGSLTASAARGREVFLSLQCNTCHSGNGFSDSSLGTRHNVGTLLPSSGKRLGQALDGLDTPGLKGIWDTPPYLHDGSAATLHDVISTRNPSGLHGNLSGLSQPLRDDLVAFLLQLDDSTSPANPYETWRHQRFNLVANLDSSVTGFLANPDGDTDTNAFEFLFGKNPLAVEPATRLLHLNPDGSRSIRFSASPAALQSFHLGARQSTDLREWQAFDMGSFTTQPAGDMIQYEANIPASLSRWFFSLSLDQ